MVVAFLSSTLLLALAVAVNPVVALVRLDLTKRLGGNTKTCTHYQGINSAVENYQSASYLAAIRIGNPPKTYQLIVDTGSANIWVGANQSYVKTNTSYETSYSVFVKYGSANFSGTEYIDQVTIAPGLVIPSQWISVANITNGFSGVDGVIGIGPTDLTNGTLFPPANSTMLVSTVTDNLFAWNMISEEVVGISFAPITNANGTELNGEITWGGVDQSKYTGDITYVHITETTPSARFWGLNMSITYGDLPLLSNNAGIMDTGTSLFLLNENSFAIYQNATGAKMDSATGLLTITPDQYENLQSLYFRPTGTDAVFEFTNNAQIWPRALNYIINGTQDGIYLAVSNGSGDPGQDFICGQACLERFYSVYDTGRRQVGLATTPYTYATTN